MINNVVDVNAAAKYIQLKVAENACLPSDGRQLVYTKN